MQRKASLPVLQFDFGQWEKMWYSSFFKYIVGLISFFMVSSLSVIFLGRFVELSQQRWLLYPSSSLIVSRIYLVCEFVFTFLKLSCVFHKSSTDALV